MRNKNIDIIKGIGIILIVAGHALSPVSYWYSSWFVQIFLIASGYTYNKQYSDNWGGVKQFIVKRIKSLYLPWLITGGILTIANNLLIKINVLTDNSLFLDAAAGNSYGLDRIYSIKETLQRLKSIALFQTAPKISGAIWFLATLFFVEIIYVIIEFICRKITKNKHTMVMDVVMLSIYAAGVYVTINGMIDNSGYRIHLIALSIFMFHIGQKLRTHEDLWQPPNPVFSCFVTLAIMYIAIKLQIGRVNYVRGDIKGGVYLFVISMAGWFFTYSLSQIIFEGKSLASDCLIYLGKNSLPILLMHQVSFKIVTYIQTIIYKEPAYMLAAFPVLYKDNGWWIIYSIVGVCVPLILYVGSKKIMQQIRGKVKGNEKI